MLPILVRPCLRRKSQVISECGDENRDRKPGLGDTLTSMFVCLFVSIDQATWFYGKPISHLLLVLPSMSLSVLVPF
jgi:hypothetical protein